MKGSYNSFKVEMSEGVNLLPVTPHRTSIKMNLDQEDGSAKERKGVSFFT